MSELAPNGCPRSFANSGASAKSVKHHRAPSLPNTTDHAFARFDGMRVRK